MYIVAYCTLLNTGKCTLFNTGANNCITIISLLPHPFICLPPGKGDDKLEKAVDGEAAREVSEPAEPGHPAVERQDSRSKQRPTAKAAAGSAPLSPQEKACPPSPVSATAPQAPKPQGKRTDRPKSPPTAGGGSTGAK